MGKLKDAATILEQLGLPQQARGPIACLTLLALAGITEQDGWDKATRRPMTVTKDIMQFMADAYGAEYQANTRESVRKSALRPFLQATLVECNPDDPDRPTTSAKYCYALTDRALSLIRRFGTPSWRQNAAEFLASSPLGQRMRRQRRARTELRLRIGEKEVPLSPGAHNQLQAAIIEDFTACFLPNARVLYLGDAASRVLHVDHAGMSQVGLKLGAQTLLPDVVFLEEQRDLVCFVEAVTSSGAITEVRLMEFEGMLARHAGPKLYVTAFPSLKVLQRFVGVLAWGTEVWVAEQPDHLIHFDGRNLMTIHR